eukprot:gene5054-8649_t
MNYEDLPNDCILEILSFLNENELCLMNMTSKKLKFSCFSNKNIFWKNIFEKKYNFEIFSIKINQENEFCYKKAVKNVYNEVEKYFSSRDLQQKNLKEFQYVNSNLLICLYNLIEEPIYSYLRITVIGDSGVGKSTIFSESEKTFYLKKSMINISFADTSGSYDYDRIRTLSYTNTNCFVLCFSLVNRQSFENITTRWVPEIDHYNQIAPIFIIGTKSDLSRDQEYLRKKGNGIPIHPNEVRKKYF